jgi:hypothetical protein
MLECVAPAFTTACAHDLLRRDLPAAAHYATRRGGDGGRRLASAAIRASGT